MRYCVLCRKHAVPGNGIFFNAPRDKNKRAEWAKLCKKDFNTSARVCIDHFSKDDIITTGSRYMLLPKATPILPQQEETALFSRSILPDNLEHPRPMESQEDFNSCETSLQGLRFFTYVELATTAVSKCPDPQFKEKESQTE